MDHIARWGKVTCRAAANIALIKYWGKLDPERQIPASPSLSLTLCELATCTTAWERVAGASSHRVYLGSQELTAEAHPKVHAHLERLRRHFPQQSYLEVRSTSTIPTQAGVASSAAGFAALTAAAVSCWARARTEEQLRHRGWTRRELAEAARLGSGSACRSFYPGFVLWEQDAAAPKATITSLEAPAGWDLADIVVVVDAAEKKLPSSAGHALAWDSPFFSLRLSHMAQQVKLARQAIDQLDWPRLGQITEQDAVEMHTVVATARPGLSYLNSVSFEVMAAVRQLREGHALPCYFTVDAGPNVHVLCPRSARDQVAAQLRARFPDLPQLLDSTGPGIEWIVAEEVL